MREFLTYNIEVAACVAVFYLFFKLLLSRETFHRANRVILLAVIVMSFVIPVCEVTIYRQAPAEALQQVLPEGIAFPLSVVEMQSGEGSYDSAEFIVTPDRISVWQRISGWIFAAGLIAVLLFVAVSIFRVTRIVRGGDREKIGPRHVLVKRNEQLTPFSWIRYIVISRKDLSDNGENIILHERAHIDFYHSIDLIVADIACCLQWFNPAMWLLRRELTALHEYEADRAVLAGGADPREYQMLLIKKAVGAGRYSIANSLNHSKLKNRITMMLQKRSNRAAAAKIGLLLPLVYAGLTAFARTEYIPVEDKVNEKNVTTDIAVPDITGPNTYVMPATPGGREIELENSMLIMGDGAELWIESGVLTTQEQDPTVAEKQRKTGSTMLFLQMDEQERKEWMESMRISEEDVRKWAESVKMDDEQMRKWSESVKMSEEEIKRLAESMKITEEQQRKWMESAKPTEEQIQRWMESIKSREEDIRKWSEAARPSEEQIRKWSESVKMSEEEIKRRAESMKMTEEQQRKWMESAKPGDEDIRKWSEAARPSEEHIRQWSETARIRGEELKKQWGERKLTDEEMELWAFGRTIDKEETPKRPSRVMTDKEVEAWVFGRNFDTEESENRPKQAGKKKQANVNINVGEDYVVRIDGRIVPKEQVGKELKALSENDEVTRIRVISDKDGKGKIAGNVSDEPGIATIDITTRKAVDGNGGTEIILRDRTNRNAGQDTGDELEIKINRSGKVWIGKSAVKDGTLEERIRKEAAGLGIKVSEVTYVVRADRATDKGDIDKVAGVLSGIGAKRIKYVPAGNR